MKKTIKKSYFLMLKKLILSLFIVLTGQMLYSKDTSLKTPELIPYRKANKWGYYDKNKNIVSECKYDEAYPFKDGLARVRINYQWGFIDKSLKEVIPCQYFGARDFSEGLAAVEGKGGWGYIDTNGRVVIPFTYYEADSFSDGLALVKLKLKGTEALFNSYKIMFIDKNGKTVINKNHIYVEKSFSDGLLRVKRNTGLLNSGNEKFGYIDKTGKEVIECKYEEAFNFSGGVAPVKEETENNKYRWVCINKKGEIVLTNNAIVRFHTGFYNGKAIVTIENENSKFEDFIIDTNGNKIRSIKLDYIIAGDFFEGLAPIRVPYDKYSSGFYRYGFIDINGDIKIQPDYDYIVSPFKNGLAVVKLNDIEFYIDRDGYEYRGATLIPYKKSKKWGFCDKNKKIVIVPQYNFAYPFYEDVTLVEISNKWKLIDQEGNEITQLKYDLAFFFSEGLAPVRKDDKWGFINTSGVEVIPLKYDYARVFSEGLAAVCISNKWGYINKKGEEVIPFIYEKTYNFYEGFGRVIYDGRNYYVDHKNKLYNYNNISSITYDVLFLFSEKDGETGFYGKSKLIRGYENALPFFDGLAPVSKNKKWGYINKEGNLVIPIKYDSAWQFFDGLALVFLSNKGFYIDDHGNEYWED
ncbi:MAG: WG repeat-containing protein [Brevinematales bacterium]|nr:WG repeat-containing protein [Brevinematales bacterium]